MPYVEFTESKPDDTQTGPAFVDSTRENMLALRDSIVALGNFPGWDSTVTTPGAEPDVIIYDKGTERVRLTYTWSGGNPATIKHEYSSNSGTDYDPMFSTNGLLTLTFDGSGFFVSGAWT
ncbi:MAG: hypothetical protein KJO55_02085 [Gammaproteobacteria bacterium]|nr:hypothetical protein [Gammaproteobacteria bacterium]